MKDDLKIGIRSTRCSDCDREEGVHGYNVYGHNSMFECSVCGYIDWDTVLADGRFNYCPNCGAKMDGRVE